VSDERLDTFMEGFAEALLLDLADCDDDEDVPIGRMICEAFEAEERGYDMRGLDDMYMTVGRIRRMARRIRAHQARL
jgi:hypothetical protein